MTVHDFVHGVFSGDGKSFKLSTSKKINDRWRGKTFAELAENEQRRIRNTTIHAIIFVQQHPEDDDTSLFQVFERINTSGRTLVPQEIRNCVSQGPLNRLLFKLNELSEWRTLFGSEKPDPRMRDMEFILRFFALSSPELKNLDKVKISLKQFLDLYMKRHAKCDEAVSSEMELRFERTIKYLHKAFGSTAFHNTSASNPKKLVSKFSPTVFDSICIATDYVLTNDTPAQPAESVRRSLMNDSEYRFAVSQETMTKKCISTRINKACEILYGLSYE